MPTRPTATASTGDGGTATVKLTPTDPSAGLKLTVRAPGPAADVPVLYVPARRDAARLWDAPGERLADELGRIARLPRPDRAFALMDALGPERVGAMLAAREDLSARYGEARVWKDAAAKVAR